ncbi:MAG: OmpA family protein [Rhodospirillales bacterium]|nr:OmpA family protein [Rhodospirillales bacterium]
MAKLSVALAAAALVGLTAAAQAQTNPTANQIIKALQPTGTISGTTRGIRPVGAPPPAPAPIAAVPAALPATAAPGVSVAPQPASTPAPAPAPTQPAPTQAAKPPSVNLSVEFANGSAALTPAARRTLDQLGKALTSAELSNYRFRIAGHTDTVGTHAFNRTLSQRRADTVARYLESKFSIPAARLEAIGRGEQGLLVPTPPQTPEPRNRRVQITNLGT